MTALLDDLLAVPTTRAQSAKGLAEQAEQHRHDLLRRGGNPFATVVSTESMPPRGCAGQWYDDVAYQAPHSARDVARQIARLCGDDTEVTTTWRSLADAVQVRDSSGRDIAYTQGGADWLRVGGWLRWEATGRGRNSMTTFQLLPGTFNWRGLAILETV